MNGWLLDTHAFLWYAAGNEQLPVSARDMIEQHPENVYLSIGSVWEMAIKISVGKLAVAMPLDDLARSAWQDIGLKKLDISPEHVFSIATLALHHRDPFDRLLAAQCRVENLGIISADPVFDMYGVGRM